jgi:sterol O-acyltransferase
LVFTRQFTTFDRLNADSAESPFHGFFTLFWLGTAIYTAQLFVANWQQHGSILGSNEIMGLMFRRDVMVLGLSDGVMCAATGFGLILQKIIQLGYLSWNREGWVIQSVSLLRSYLKRVESMANPNHGFLSVEVMFRSVGKTVTLLHTNDSSV